MAPLAAQVQTFSERPWKKTWLHWMFSKTSKLLNLGRHLDPLKSGQKLLHVVSSIGLLHGIYYIYTNRIRLEYMQYILDHIASITWPR